jgi:hypothetical protein
MPPRKGSKEAAGITPEKLALIEKCLDEGWPFVQISRTHNVSWNTLDRHFRGRGMDLKEAAKLGNVAMKTSVALRNMRHT